MKRAHGVIRKVAKHAALHVVPHPDNGHVPHLLRGSYLFGAGAIAVIVFVAIAWGGPVSRDQLTAAVYSSVLVDLTNEAREEKDLGTLTVNPTLERAALLKATDMAAKGYFAHTSPEGLSPWYWLDQAGYTFIYAGENLAVHFEDTEDVQAALYASPTHRANILDSRFTEIGIATVRGTYQGKKTTFVVESFGTPAKLAVAATPEALPTSTTTNPEVETPAADETATVLGETAPTPADVPAPKLTPVNVVYEDEKVAVAENASPDVQLAEVAPAQFAQARTVAPAQQPRLSSWYQRFIMNPGPTAVRLYTLFALLVAAGTLAMLAHETARRQTKHIAYGASFVLFMLMLIGIGQRYAFAAIGAV